jgi:hypothetical protein
LCDEFGIIHQFLAKYTPQLNGIVKRKNRTLINMARSMLSEYNVDQSFWPEAINMACYCSNRLYCHPLKEKTTYELLNGRKPNIAYFQVFLANATYWEKALDWASLTRNVIKDSCLDTQPLAKLIEFGIWKVALLKSSWCWINETKGSQDENENLDDVRGI